MHNILSPLEMIFGLAAVVASVSFIVLFGGALAFFIPGLTFMQAGWQMLAITGTGWVVQAIISKIGLAYETWKKYMFFLCRLLLMGVLILVPAIILILIGGYRSWLIPASSIVISIISMLIVHIYWAKQHGLSQKWTIFWFLSLQIGAWLLVLIFYF